MQPGHLTADDRGERGRVVREGLPEPCGAQSGLVGLPRELHRGVDPVLERECYANGHTDATDRRVTGIPARP
ncbi:hypothetical protein GCM10012280_64500 [Wenjunlia tyrosinilytica]|uniref:Uncharacterized protein n=1 Tax=Wenjunlia tyrosinilytica TaxID=1544741 RepID=A0A918E0M5_9ACTN|nr:hypothetical protein GCM10012280_64500 [Wenjunlia tyrosinilytica]